MYKVKIIFESDIEGEQKKFGYIIDKETMSYQTVHFDKRYEPFDVQESRPIGDLTVFGKSIWRVIRSALQGSKNGSS